MELFVLRCRAKHFCGVQLKKTRGNQNSKTVQNRFSLHAPSFVRAFASCPLLLPCKERHNAFNPDARRQHFHKHRHGALRPVLFLPFILRLQNHKDFL